MIDPIQRELIFFWHYFTVMLQMIFKFWLLGMVLGSLVSVFGKEKIHVLFSSLQGRKLGTLGVIPASLLGIASPLCMFGTIPIAASFSQKGIREDWLAAFMVSSILLNPQLMFYTAALGIDVLVIRFVLSLLCGIVAGIIIRTFYAEKRFFNFSGFDEPKSRDTDPNLFLRFLKNLGRNVKTTGPFFLGGVILSVLFQRYMPPDFFIRLFGGNRGFGILMASTVGVPMYICGGSTIPLIQSWLRMGMSMGTAVAFMIAGPAMKITNLGALKVVLGIKHFLLYILFAFAFAFISGFIVDLIVS